MPTTTSLVAYLPIMNRIVDIFQALAPSMTVVSNGALVRIKIDHD